MNPGAITLFASEDLCDKVLGLSIEVHRELGPGLLESVCEKTMVIALRDAGLHAECQVDVPVFFRGRDVGCGFRADIIVEKCLLLELKAVAALTDIHVAQTLNYLKLLGFKTGFLLNFNVLLMKQGIKRVSN